MVFNSMVIFISKLSNAIGANSVMCRVLECDFSPVNIAMFTGEHRNSLASIFQIEKANGDKKVNCPVLRDLYVREINLVFDSLICFEPVERFSSVMKFRSFGDNFVKDKLKTIVVVR